MSGPYKVGLSKISKTSPKPNWMCILGQHLDGLIGPINVNLIVGVSSG